MGIAVLIGVVRWINNSHSYKYHDLAHRHLPGGYPAGHFLDDQGCLSLRLARKCRFEYTCVGESSRKETYGNENGPEMKTVYRTILFTDRLTKKREKKEREETIPRVRGKQ